MVSVYYGFLEAENLQTNPRYGQGVPTTTSTYIAFYFTKKGHKLSINSASDTKKERKKERCCYRCIFTYVVIRNII